MKRHNGKFRLTKLSLDEVSFVVSGDDPEAHIVLMKASPEGKDLYVPGPMGKKCKCKNYPGRDSGKCKRCGGMLSKDDGNEYIGGLDPVDFKYVAKIANPKSTMKEIVGSHGPSILWPAMYEHLRKKGYSKEKSARISNAGWKKKRMGVATNTPMSALGSLS